LAGAVAGPVIVVLLVVAASALVAFVVVVDDTGMKRSEMRLLLNGTITSCSDRTLLLCGATGGEVDEYDLA